MMDGKGIEQYRGEMHKALDKVVSAVEKIHTDAVKFLGKPSEPRPIPTDEELTELIDALFEVTRLEETMTGGHQIIKFKILSLGLDDPKLQERMLKLATKKDIEVGTTDITPIPSVMAAGGRA